jgi:hypothetical protein
MKHSSLTKQRHSTDSSKSAKVEILPLSARFPGDAFLRDETERNRKSERWLLLYGAIAIILVVILVVIRLVFFS